MPKNLDDIIPPERTRSIRNIRIPENRRRTEKTPAAAERPTLDAIKRHAAEISPKETVGSEESFTMPRKMIPRKRGSRKKLWLSAGVGTVILLFALLSFFDGATLSYTPKRAELSFANELYSAEKTGENNLVYSLVKLSAEKGQAVPARGEQEVSRKASGTIVIYNSASSEPQKLVENTRFESPSGKIYRIATTITIPGKKGDQPGSIEALVYADVAGPDSNSDLVDLTLPGLKGTARYENIYARSKTPMTGGFTGKEKIVEESELKEARTTLESALREELTAKARAEAPDDFILLPGLATFTFEDKPQTESGEGTATVNLKANLLGVMFKKTELSRALAEKETRISAGETVEFETFEKISASFAGQEPDLLAGDRVDFRISGTATLLWSTDELALINDLLGKSKSEISTILRNYPTIRMANATVRPLWRRTFPDQPEKITIKKLKTE